MKKLRKLSLKKEVILHLDKDEMSRIVGGEDLPTYFVSIQLAIVTCVTYVAESVLGFGCKTKDCPDTNFIDPTGGCYTNDYEICRTR